MPDLGFVFGDDLFAGAVTVNIGLWILFLIVHIAFAIGVSTHSRGLETTLVGRGIWVIATLLGGPLVAVGYWLMHASALAPGALSDRATVEVEDFVCRACNTASNRVTTDRRCIHCGRRVDAD